MNEVAVDWWRSWFDSGYLALYDPDLSQRTPHEVDQLEALLHIRPPLRILDLACGQARHAIDLGRRGYQVTGVDLSPYMLSIARQRAEAAGVQVRFIEGDMREPIGGDRFDVILNLFTSFGYFADEADDRQVVISAAGMLEQGGCLVLEVVNGERVMRNFQEREWFTVGDKVVLERRSLDRATRRMTVHRTVRSGDTEVVNQHVLRLYGAAEMQAVLENAGLKSFQLYGEWDGSPVTAESSRVLVVARRE